ncbi:MAG: hypothetical protein SWH78_16560 [Thermodesulfobacteriota bacterium]|nr:hypothetical protein [Thermodesulfobacteriota bacterium]
MGKGELAGIPMTDEEMEERHRLRRFWESLREEAQDTLLALVEEADEKNVDALELFEAKLRLVELSLKGNDQSSWN